MNGRRSPVTGADLRRIGAGLFIVGILWVVVFGLIGFRSPLFGLLFVAAGAWLLWLVSRNANEDGGQLSDDYARMNPFMREWEARRSGSAILAVLGAMGWALIVGGVLLAWAFLR